MKRQKVLPKVIRVGGSEEILPKECCIFIWEKGDYSGIYFKCYGYFDDGEAEWCGIGDTPQEAITSMLDFADEEYSHLQILRPSCCFLEFKK